MRIPKLDAVRFLPFAAFESLDRIFDRVSLLPSNPRHDPLQRTKEIETPILDGDISQAMSRWISTGWGAFHVERLERSKNLVDVVVVFGEVRFDTVG